MSGIPFPEYPDRGIIMADITVTTNTRASLSVTAGDVIQAKSGRVLIGAANVVGDGVLLENTAVITIGATATIYYEKISEGPAIIAHEAL
jgi:hypothetical protein